MTDVRRSLPEDTQAILAMSRAESLFSEEDVECVQELLEDYFDDPDEDEYTFLTAVNSGEVAGYACYGPTPLTQGTFDLYWINVGRAHRRNGVGHELIAAVEDAVRRQGGRLVTIDTSGLPSFAPTRAFYERCGYAASSRVPDFFGPGDDLVKFYRNLHDAGPPVGLEHTQPEAEGEGPTLFEALFLEDTSAPQDELSHPPAASE